MTILKTFANASLLTFCALLTLGCDPHAPASVVDSVAVVAPQNEDSPVSVDPLPLPENVPAPADDIKPAQKNSSKKETLYISTFGAQGEVWGYVTMTGNSGRGTIHDLEENTLSITVTRHGNELYGTDQNGRGYVFKL